MKLVHGYVKGLATQNGKSIAFHYCHGMPREKSPTEWLWKKLNGLMQKPRGKDTSPVETIEKGEGLLTADTMFNGDYNPPYPNTVFDIVKKQRKVDTRGGSEI